MASPELPPSDKVAEEGAKNVADEVTDKAAVNETDNPTNPTAEATADTTTGATTDATTDTTAEPATEEPVIAPTAVQAIKKILQRPKSKSVSPPPKGQAPDASNKSAEESAAKPGLLETICSKLPSGHSSSCPRCDADGALGDCKVCGWNGGFGGDS